MVETRGMVQEKLTLAVRPRGKPAKKLPEDVVVSAMQPTTEIYQQLASSTGTTVHRLRITKGSDGSFIPNSKTLLIDTTGLRQQSTIYVKDLGTARWASQGTAQVGAGLSTSALKHQPHANFRTTAGPQIAWRTVFLVEYFGPLFIHPILYLTLPDPAPSYLQSLTLALVLIHFSKRELETLFVHRFSTATMPAFNIFKNSVHYWCLSGFNIAYWVYRPAALAAQEGNPYITMLGLAAFVVGEACNFLNHVTLRNLRSPGGTERGIPQGLGFSLVTCPNYMFEALAWTGMVLVSRSLSTALFAVVALAQMGVWAKKKEVKYRREFGQKYQKKRYCMIPGLW